MSTDKDDILAAIAAVGTDLDEILTKLTTLEGQVTAGSDAAATLAEIKTATEALKTKADSVAAA